MGVVICDYQKIDPLDFQRVSSLIIEKLIILRYEKPHLPGNCALSTLRDPIHSI